MLKDFTFYTNNVSDLIVQVLRVLEDSDDYITVFGNVYGKHNNRAYVIWDTFILSKKLIKDWYVVEDFK